VVDLLKKVKGLGEDNRTLTPSGMRILGRLQIDLESAAKSSSLAEHFEIEGPIARGSSSIALKAVNRRVRRPVVLKILQPVLPEVAEAAIARLGSLDGIPHLVAPIDSDVIETESVAGDRLRLYCIVFPLVRAITLEEYLSRRPPITPFFFEAFIRQIGGVLEKLEERECHTVTYTGETSWSVVRIQALNLLLLTPRLALARAPHYSRSRSDFEWLQRHLSEALVVLQRHLPSVSIQSTLGLNSFRSSTRSCAQT